MKIIIESPFNHSEHEIESMKNRLSDLQKYEDRATQLNLYYKKGDGSGDRSISANIRVEVPGQDVFADAYAEDSYSAFSDVYQKIKRQLIDRRDQLNDHHSEVKEIRDIVNGNF